MINLKDFDPLECLKDFDSIEAFLEDAKKTNNEAFIVEATKIAEEAKTRLSN